MGQSRLTKTLKIRTRQREVHGGGFRNANINRNIESHMHVQSCKYMMCKELRLPQASSPE